MTDAKELPDLIASQLAHYDSNLTTPEISAMTAAIVGCNAYRAQGGQLLPTSREAVASVANFVPRAFLIGVSRAASELAPNAMAKTAAFLTGVGATDMEGVGGVTSRGLPSELAAAVQRDVSATDSVWARNREVMVTVERAERKAQRLAAGLPWDE